jgi:hypothetical protein
LLIAGLAELAVPRWGAIKSLRDPSIISGWVHILFSQRTHSLSSPLKVHSELFSPRLT